MKFKLLTFLYLLKIHTCILHIQIEVNQISEGNGLDLYITEYSLEDKSQTDVKKTFLTCDFDASIFCKDKTNIHYFELFQETNKKISQIKADVTTYASTKYTCPGLLNEHHDLNILKKKYIRYVNYKPSVLIKYFAFPQIVHCSVKNMGVLEGTDGSIYYHHLIFSIGNEDTVFEEGEGEESFKDGFKIVKTNFKDNLMKKYNSRKQGWEFGGFLEKSFGLVFILFGLIY